MQVQNAKVAVFSVGLDVEDTDTKGTILIKDADSLKTYNKSEEDAMEAIIKELADAGVTVAVFGSKISEIATHFLERYQIMICKVCKPPTITHYGNGLTIVKHSDQLQV